MRPLIRLSLVVAGLVAAAGQASAADPASGAPILDLPPPAVTDWTGFHIGGHAGGGVTEGDLRADYLPYPTFGLNPTLAHSSASAFVGGVQGGYNWQFASTWVAGIEADYSRTRMDSTLTAIPRLAATGLPVPAQPTTWTRDLNWLASARARLGYLATPGLLLYGSGGAAWGGFDDHATFVNTLAGSNNWSHPFSATASGYVVGTGAEWMFAPHWMVRGEYLFYHLGETSQLAGNPAFPAFPIQFTFGATDTHVARLAISYKF